MYCELLCQRFGGILSLTFREILPGTDRDAPGFGPVIDVPILIEFSKANSISGCEYNFVLWKAEYFLAHFILVYKMLGIAFG